jgi:hypothetical protein
MINVRTPDSAIKAAVRSGVLCSLIEALPRLAPEVYSELAPPLRALRLSLRGGAVHRRLEFAADSAAELPSTGMFLPSVILNFLHEGGMASRLAGKPALILPVPAGYRAIKGVRLFAGASSHISALTSAPYPQGSPQYELQTRFLLTAALRGVCEVGQNDPWTRGKSSRLPLGVLEIIVGGAGDPVFTGYIVRENLRGGVAMRYLPGWRRNELFPDGDATRPAARLRFADMTIAGDILRGRANAMEALGRGTVSISGRIPYIQGIFPLLDRFSEVMAADAVNENTEEHA